jgi:hypothetical protein
VLRLAGCCEELAVLFPQLWLVRLRKVNQYELQRFERGILVDAY